MPPERPAIVDAVLRAFHEDVEARALLQRARAEAEAEQARKRARRVKRAQHRQARGA